MPPLPLDTHIVTQPQHISVAPPPSLDQLAQDHRKLRFSQNNDLLHNSMCRQYISHSMCQDTDFKGFVWRCVVILSDKQVTAKSL